MTVFKKILVAIDRSLEADNVFEQALDMAQSQESSLLIFHGLQPESNVRTDYLIGVGTIGDLGLYAQTQRRQRAHLQKRIADVQSWLQGYSQDAVVRGISAELIHRVGDPGPEICEVARDWQVDLIVMGRRGRQGLSEMVLGSVSNYVVHHALCSVLIVQVEGFIGGKIEASQSSDDS